MKSSILATFGSWKSPISTDIIVSGSIGLGEVTFDNEDIYLLESRATERDVMFSLNVMLMAKSQIKHLNHSMCIPVFMNMGEEHF
ncbi:hypothetical protein ETSB_0739 [cyanobacterium endosymbiont of Epithemia turgida isolate EtSB Lake Yunoko]|nr:hypothetical protein ETSB_0739 [cyanobacterium endosymbiont of Epithemia turgida isolate EtSB Lake Yunoko]